MKKLIRKLSVMLLASLLIVSPSFGGIFDSGNKGNIFPSDTFDSLTLSWVVM